MKTIISAIFALVLGALPSQAVPALPSGMGLSGSQFFAGCGDPYRDPATLAACRRYVTGVAVGLQGAGRACFGQGVTQPQLVGVSLRWIGAHEAYAYRPASFMIGNGLAAAFSCQRRTVQPRPITADQALAAFGKTVKFIELTKALLAALG